MTPFEIFRTPIQIRRFTQGFYLNGIWQEGSQFTLSGNFSGGNVIVMSLNGVSIPPIFYTGNQAATIAAMQTALASQPNIQQVDISANQRTFTIVPLQPNLSTVTVSVSGANAPTVTVVNSPTIIPATASVQPIGKDVALVPEGRRDKADFTFFTSTEIYGMTTQNPDQITVIKAPFTGIVYEVYQINDWQNNSTFNLVNHYKFAALRLHPLPGVLG